jgi:hypothetical protein
MITHKEVEKIIPTGLKIVLDVRYNLPTDEEVLEHALRFIKLRGPFVYEDDSHDCDNAAVEMLAHFSGKGWAFGLAILEGHVVNFYINNRRELKFLEPQNGLLFEPITRLKISVMI